VDAKFDQVFSDAIGKSLRGIPKFQFSGTTLTKTVDGKAYEETFRASTASAVMFVNVDYHLSTDFSTLEVSARGLVYPRSAGARTASGLAAELPAAGKDPVLALNAAAYRLDLGYRGKLPDQAASPADYVAAWKADNARMLRAGVSDAAAQIGRLLAEDMQRAPDSQRTVIRKAEPAKGLPGDLLAESNGSQLLLLPSGGLQFRTTLSKDAGAASAAAPAATSATGTVAAQ